MNTHDQTDADMTAISVDQLTHAANELLSVGVNESNSEFGGENLELESRFSYHSRDSNSMLQRFNGLDSMNRPINLLSPARLNNP